MKKNRLVTIIIFLIISSLQLHAQNNQSKFDYRLGMGYAQLTPDKTSAIFIENEFNFKFSRYFATSATLNYGRSSTNDVYNYHSVIQGNLNIFVSPFRNDKRNDFRLGTGLSFNNRFSIDNYNVYENGQLINYYFPRGSKSFGPNIIIENTYTLSDKFLIGLKLFSQPYFTGDINSGALLKLGMKI